MTTRWRSGLAAVGVSAAVVALVAVDVADGTVRRWWAEHPFTCSVVSGLLVLLVTVLVVDQVSDLRQARDRGRAVAAQASIVFGQARRSVRSVEAALDGDGPRDDAADDIRNFLTMLLVSAPVLLDTVPARSFLEEAERLGARLTRLVTAPDGSSVTGGLDDALDDALARLQAVAAPLLDVLHPDERSAATGG